MQKPMTKSEIFKHMADSSGMTKRDVETFFDLFTKLAYKEAKNTFTVPGLGKLVLVQRKARTGRNPATGETIQIKAKKVVKFRVSKIAKDVILK